jgi:3-dehydroquinate synthetase
VLLNLGHTVGHALEAHGGYHRWLHGEAVALGVVTELEAGVRMGFTPPALVERARALLSALGLPTRVERSELAASWPYVAADKKRAGSSLRLPVVAAPGEAMVERVRLEALHVAVLPT